MLYKILRVLTGISSIWLLGRAAKLYLEGNSAAAYYALLACVLFAVIALGRKRQ